MPDLTNRATAARHAEDELHTSGDPGALVLAVRHDAADSLVNADGDYAPPQVDDLGTTKTGIPTRTPTVYNVTLTNANTEYLQALPDQHRGFEFQCRDDATVVRFAWETGRVAAPTPPYMTLQAGDYYYSYTNDPGAALLTLYFASATAGAVVEVIAWT